LSTVIKITFSYKKQLKKIFLREIAQSKQLII